jgi:hypothetical protein
MLRELVCHREKIARDFDGVLEGAGVVRCYTADKTLAYAELPQHGSQPLLGYAQIRSLAFGAIQIRWECLRQLTLKLCNPRRIAMGLKFIPQTYKRVIHWLVQVYQAIEPRRNRSI